jgi:hypothetical protein
MHWPEILWSTTIVSVLDTLFFKLSLLSTLVLTPLLLKSLLDCENNEGDYTDASEGSYKVIYEEPDLSRGVEGIDYCMSTELRRSRLSNTDSLEW